MTKDSIDDPIFGAGVQFSSPESLDEDVYQGFLHNDEVMRSLLKETSQSDTLDSLGRALGTNTSSVTPREILDRYRLYGLEWQVAKRPPLDAVAEHLAKGPPYSDKCLERTLESLKGQEESFRIRGFKETFEMEGLRPVIYDPPIGDAEPNAGFEIVAPDTAVGIRPSGAEHDKSSLIILPIGRAVFGPYEGLVVYYDLKNQCLGLLNESYLDGEASADFDFDTTQDPDSCAASFATVDFFMAKLLDRGIEDGLKLYSLEITPARCGRSDTVVRDSATKKLIVDSSFVCRD